ncbi:hypothetical protein [Actinoplanes sp. NPDC049316]|uniref:hypothetical protein n=1 Tax=Actinoplanes sp. NPDC049316 TaxID=3154727 RepID=UPI003415C4D7
MALVRAFDDHEYLPDYSTLVLLDPDVTWGPEDPEVPRYRDRGDKPTGTFAGSGGGWITAQADDLADHTVRLELHDCPPPADHDDFDDVLETPYRAASGGVSLAWLTDGPGERVDLTLGDNEWFRVRIALQRRDAGNLYTWLLRFWPASALEPPVFLARSQPAAGPGDNYYGLAHDLEAILRWTPPPSLEIPMGDLAERLMVDQRDLRGALAYAEEAGLLHADGDHLLHVRLGRRAES